MAGSQARAQDADWLSHRWALAVLALLTASGLGLRLAIAWQALPSLIQKTLPDDAFYYFGIARNIVAGHGSTFDGIHATNGYHPLWLAFLLPLYALTSGDSLPIHLALTLSALFGAATAVVLFFVARELTGRRDVALLAAGFFALDGPVILQSMNGLESALALLLFAVALLLFVRVWRRTWTGVRAWAALGAALGLLVLARTDYALFAAASLLVLALVLPARERLRAMGAATAVAALVLAPWLLWSLVTFGTVVQDSGRSLPYVVHENFRADHSGTAGELHHSYELTRTTITDTIPRTYLVPAEPFRLPFLIGVPVAVALLIVAVRASERRRLWRSIAPLLPAIVALAGLVIIHAAVRWYVRPWYFMALVPIVALLLAAVLAPLLDRLRGLWGPALLCGVGALLVAGFAYRGVRDWDRGLYFCPDDLLAGSTWLEQSLGPADRAASFNGGVLGYFGHRPVADLDGAVNNSVFGALQRKELYAYLQRERIGYLVDNGYFLDSAFGIYWGAGITQVTSTLQPVASFSSCGAAYPWGTTYVFRVPGGPAAGGE